MEQSLLEAISFSTGWETPCIYRTQNFITSLTSSCPFREPE